MVPGPAAAQLATSFGAVQQRGEAHIDDGLIGHELAPAIRSHQPLMNALQRRSG
jgi:hypothetical protein